MTRRELIATAAALPGFAATSRIDASRVSAITDEIGITAESALEFAKLYDLKWIELRGVPAKRPVKGPEYARMPEAEVKAAAATFRERGLKVSFLNSSLMKFQWPGTEPVRPRKDDPAKQIEQEKLMFERRLDTLRTAIRAAHILEVNKLRVFAGMRVAEPAKLFPRIADVLGEMTKIAEKEGIWLLIENEGACNVATCAELVQVLKMVPSKALGVNWDPLNETSQGENPYPDGYAMLPKKRIGNVQIKGHSLLDEKRRLDWPAIFNALARDGYKGQVGLETHYFSPGVDLIQKSHESMREILRLVRET